MKRFLSCFVFVFLLMASFLGGTWYNQHGAGKTDDARQGRRILHYVDPMNPAHISDKPGVAPCGMPLEPVYEDEEPAGSSLPGQGPSISPATVKITPQKQQIIGIRLGTVETVSETHGVRTLGRVAADENQIYTLIAATDGWMHDVHGGTTGSLVKEDQVLALIKVFNYDFFSWQQRYLTDLTNIGRRRQPATPFTGARQPGALQYTVPQTDPSQPGLQRKTMLPEALQGMLRPQTAQQPESQQPEVKSTEPQRPQTPPAGAPRQIAMQPQGMPSQDLQHGAHHPDAVEPNEKQPSSKHSMPSHPFLREDDILYANRSRLELLELGVEESQLEELAGTGRYATFVELRSPVAGMVLSRKISPRQKIDRGKECFQIADLSRVWVIADVFDTEAQYIRPGMRAMISIPRQGNVFEATVSDVLPKFDAATRTLKVRLEVDNPGYVLLPEMFVDVEFLISFPPAITVPADAVLDSGSRKTVFVDLGNGYFEPRPVETGWRFEDRVEILKGLLAGERIVTSGNFLIDSESKMKLAAAGLYGTPEKDPVCGSDVYPAKARQAGLISEIEGKTYYFGSEECKAQFERELSPHAETGPLDSERHGPSDAQEIKMPTGISKCPVCGMEIHASRAKADGLTAEVEGRVYYFCSKSCKRLFDKTPQRYLAKVSGDKPHQGAPVHGEHKHD